MSNTLAIHDKVTTCLDALERAISTKDEQKVSEPLFAVSLQDELGRLKFWAANTGALQIGDASLDYRLQEAPVMYENILKMLADLHEEIGEVVDLLSGTRTPASIQKRYDDLDRDDVGNVMRSYVADQHGNSDPDESDSSRSIGDANPTSELEVRRYSIADIVDNLYRISVLIRSRRPRVRFSTGSSRQAKDVDPNSRLSHEIELVKDAFRKAREKRNLPSDAAKQVQESDNILLWRIAAANFYRRRQFEYWKKHRDKLGIRVDNTELDLDDESPNEESQGEAVIGGLQAAHTKRESHRPDSEIPDDMSSTVATQFIPDIAKSTYGGSTTSFLTSAKDLDDRKVELPPPPLSVPLNSAFECPYCFAMKPVQYQEPKLWREHQLRDLAPYMCSYLECEDFDLLFGSRHEWLEHESYHRSCWKCPEFCGAEFEKRGSLEEHIKEHHAKVVAREVEQALLDVSNIPKADDRRECFMCLVRLPSARDLQDHVANHLEMLAAFTLPSFEILRPRNSGLPNDRLRTIRTSISRKMYRNGIRDNRSQSFITRDRLLEVWSNQRDGSSPLDEIQPYVQSFSRDEILDRLLSTISILVLMLWNDWSHLADWFGPGKFTDGNLPLSPEDCERVFQEDGAEFHSFQFAFIPVIIKQNETVKLPNPNWRLPLSVEDEPNDTGSYGTVTKVRIAKGYFQKEDGTVHNGELVAARKLFLILPNYEAEVRNLNILRSSVLNHDRIMEHLGSVIIGETFNIFFQWADLNLEQFFDDELRPRTINRDMITPKNLLKESIWLASALEYLHTQLLDEDGKAVHCCHMDLKPDNILVVVRDPAFPLGKWKIADFGISNIEPRSMSVSIRDFYARTTTTRPGTRPAAIRSLRYPGPFQPPEAESSEKAMYATKKDVNDLKGDIWSFGCILLVVLVFAIGGTPYVDELANRRQVLEIDFDGQSRTGFFYRKVTGPPQIMPAIVSWIIPLARTQAVWFEKAWSFISRHMLVADPANRIGAEVVRHCLCEWMDMAQPRNIWNEAPKLEPFSSSSTLTGPPQPPAAGQEEKLRPQSLRRSTQTPTVPRILEYSELVTPVWTVPNPEQVEGLTPTATPPESQGYSPSSETTSQMSSTSTRSGGSGPVGNLSQDLSKEKLVVISSDGQRIAFANQGRAKIFSKRPDDVAVFSKEIVQNIESRPRSKWEQVHFAGPVIALRDEDTLNIFSWNLMTEPTLQDWGHKVRTQDVVGFDVSQSGAVAFRFPRAIKVFSSVNSLNPDLDCTFPKENIKALAFSRTGDRFIAVSDTAWFSWEIANSSAFSLTIQGKHGFVRPEHGNFQPCIISFNKAPAFLLWDRVNRDRTSIITKNYNTVQTVPMDTRAIEVSCDDQKLVLLTVKVPTMGFGRHRYALHWTEIFVDPTGYLTTGREYKKYEFGVRSSAGLPLSMVTLRDNDVNIALVAFADGRIERVILN